MTAQGVLTLILLAGTSAGHGAPSGAGSSPVTVMGDPTDVRVAAVREAIAFWNSELERLGSRSRFGEIRMVPDRIPDDVLDELSRAVSQERGARGLSRWLEPIDGEVTVVLANSDLMSFSIPWRSGSGGVVVLRQAGIPPLSLPNVARNVAAHELGHLLGLSHNADPSTLMCGRPAPCRPDLFASPTAKFFPLTQEEENRLRESSR